MILAEKGFISAFKPEASIRRTDPCNQPPNADFAPGNLIDVSRPKPEPDLRTAAERLAKVKCWQTVFGAVCPCVTQRTLKFRCNPYIQRYGPRKDFQSAEVESRKID